jgi:hypothetical protein
MLNLHVEQHCSWKRWSRQSPIVLTLLQYFDMSLQSLAVDENR